MFSKSVESIFFKEAIINIYSNQLTIVEGDPKAPFSITVVAVGGGGYTFP